MHESGFLANGTVVRWNGQVRVKIDTKLCQGHGRCYDLASQLFGADDEGYGTVFRDGVVPPDAADDARLAVANCPEQAIELLEEE
jgi:ferredoxin